MNFLVFNIKVCMVYVGSLNWANYAFHMIYSAFYQVAAAQDKLEENIIHDYIQQGNSNCSWSYFKNSFISLTGMAHSDISVDNLKVSLHSRLKILTCWI